ncbi:CdaR family protein [Streptococcus cameli]
MTRKYTKLGHLVVSVLVSLILFFYATTTNYKNTLTTKQNQATETYTHSISNVPIDIRYDNEKYFISGFSSTVNIDLIGSNRVILQKETDETTRSFAVVADLSNLKSGQHTVQLKVRDLPTGVNAVLTPAAMPVKIGKRASQTFEVRGTITPAQVEKGYSVSKIVVDIATVKVTSDEEILSKIDHVEAIIADASDLSTDYSGTATLQAVDAEGNILPVVFSQEVARLQATITKDK